MKNQIEMPGMERKAIKALDQAAEEYRDIRDRRMKLTEAEGLAKDKLKKLMIKHELSTYVYESDEMDDEDQPKRFDIVIEGEPDVKVRTHKEPKPTAPEEKD